jgi:hypothetical protein
MACRLRIDSRTERVAAGNQPQPATGLDPDPRRMQRRFYLSA